MKRLGVLNQRKTHRYQVVFVAPDTPCHVIYTLYLISDCYMGLDQQYDLNIECV